MSGTVVIEVTATCTYRAEVAAAAVESDEYALARDVITGHQPVMVDIEHISVSRAAA